MEKQDREKLIEIQNLEKVYKIRERHGLFRTSKRDIVALNGVNLDIYKGEFFGLLGPNGAGKTTLIKCLTTLLLPSKGTAKVGGFDVVKNERKVQALAGCMLMGERGLYWKLTGRENLRYFASLYMVPKKIYMKRIEALIERLSLGDFIDRSVESYSAGQKMKLAFAKALINDAELLILDEPTNTLDVNGARELRQIVKNLNAEGRTIVYSTHIMSEADELCDRVAVIDNGNIIALGKPENMKKEIDQGGVIKIHGTFPDNSSEFLKDLPSVKNLNIVEVDGYQELSVDSSQPRSLLPDLISVLYDNKAVVTDIIPSRTTLEDVFVELTGRKLSEDTIQVER